MTLETIEITTPNCNAIKDFYENILELPSEIIDEKTIAITIGNATLKFIETQEKSKSIYHLAFNIPKNKLEEAIQWSKNRMELIEKKNEVLIADFESWNANSVYFFDCDGNLLEFIARHDLDNATTEPFGSNQILNISEIGIVTEKPDEYAQNLMEKYGLQLFEKNQNSEIFSAIGDDNGLLIVVKSKRNWFPTEIPAESNWTRIKLQHLDKKIELDINPTNN